MRLPSTSISVLASQARVTALSRTGHRTGSRFISIKWWPAPMDRRWREWQAAR
jgi:hypothetical protein